MWTRLPPPSTTDSGSGEWNGGRLFACLVLGFAPETCFVVTQAWERLASSATCDEGASEAESSYRHFFELAGNDGEKDVRSHLMDCVEDFRCDTCRSHLMEGILLGKV